jgi:hypothetical protein
MVNVKTLFTRLLLAVLILAISIVNIPAMAAEEEIANESVSAVAVLDSDIDYYEYRESVKNPSDAKDEIIIKEDGKEYYVLADGEIGIGLYVAGNGGDNTTFKNWANKAYLVLPKVNNAASFSFRFPGTTAIENVEVENEVKAIYDLTGRRVEAITAPGIYIIGGKKVLVK